MFAATPYVAFSFLAFRWAVSSAIDLIGDFGSTTSTKPSLASVVTGMKSLTGSNGTFLNVDRAAAIVELPGEIRIV